MSGQNPSFPYGSKIYTDADFSVPDTPDRVVEPYAGGTRFFKPFSQSEQPLQELGLLDVTRPPFCADMTGIQDATKALRDCIAAAQRYQLVCWIPLGTYRISDTLPCRQNIWWQDYPFRAYRISARRYPVVIMGERRAKGDSYERPVIRLSAHAPGFGYPEHPKPVLDVFYGAESAAHSAPASIENMITGLRLVIEEGNKGAIGARFYAAQGCSMEDCVLDMGDGYCGIWGSAGNGGSHCQNEIHGGKIGVLIEKGTPGSVLSGFLLDHQRDHAVVCGAKQAVDLVGCRIVSDSQKPPVVSFGGQYDLINQGQLSLIDCIITFEQCMPDGMIQAAISSRESMYLHNVYIRNASHAVWNPDGSCLSANGGDWCHVRQWGHGVPSMPHEGRIYTSPLYTDGKRADKSTLDAGILCAPPPPDLLNKHRSHLPLWQDVLDCNVKTRWGAVGDGIQDDTDALQHALDAGGDVFLPKGYYRITRTLHLKTHTRLIGVAQNLSQIIVTQTPEGAFGKAQEAVPALDTPDASEAAVILAYCGIVTSRQMPQVYALRWRVAGASVLRNFVFYADPGYRFTWASMDRHHPWVLVTGSGGGRWFHFWCDQTQGGSGYRILRIQGTREPFSIYACNPEHSRSEYEMDILDSQNVMIYNLKSECNAPNLLICRSRNIALFSSGGDATVPEGEALYRIQDSSDILLTLLYDYRIFSHGHGPEYFSGTWVDPMKWSMVCLEKQGCVQMTAPCERPFVYQIGTYRDPK